MASSRNIRLSVSGMSCAGCVANVENALRQLDGVTEATVNFAEHTASVITDASDEVLVQAVRDAGYDAAVMLANDAEQMIEKEQEEIKYYRQLVKKSWVAAAIGIPLFVSGMAGYLPGLEDRSAQMFWLFVGIVTFVALYYSARHFYLGAWQAFKHHNANMDTLIALGTGAAWVYSSVVVVFYAYLPEQVLHIYYEAAVIIVAFINFGSALETRARGKTSEAIKRLINLQAKTASVIRSGKEVQVPIEEVGLDETIRVRPGESIAVDGVLIDGSSLVDESMLTGESMPVAKQAGDKVSAGTMNKAGSFLFQSKRIGKDTALSRIIEMVRTAQASKPDIGRLVDKVAAVFVPSVLIISILTFLVWFNLSQDITLSLVATITVLIVACPCALGLATPISIMLGVGKAAEFGVLIRNGDALQQAGKLTTLVLDKTGTVTEGRPAVTDIYVVGDNAIKDILYYAASLESLSEHALAIAIVDAAKTDAIQLAEVAEFKMMAGQGVVGVIENQKILLGNNKLMTHFDISISEHDEYISMQSKQARTPVYLAKDGQLLGIISIADPIKPESAIAIQRLHEQKLKIILLTGDNRLTAAAVANALGIAEVIANVMPDEKAAKIAALQASGEIVGMVGDGINDAPALARADVGFAIGTGTDVAIESADITLMRGSLNSVVDAIEISRATVSNIKQNLFGAFIYNSLGIPIAAGVLYPLSGILLNPMLAGAAMAMSSVTVVMNANRLRLFRSK